MDKRIFLDIDGVMNHRNSRKDHATKWEALSEPKSKADRLAGISPRMVSLFNTLVKETRAKVILSSTWRLPDIFGADNTLRRLKEEGLDPSISFDGITEDFHSWDIEHRKSAIARHGTVRDPHTNWRRFEILEFLRQVRAEPRSFIVLDDLLGWGNLQSRVVQTRDEVGFTSKHLQRAIGLLK